MIGIIDYGMGNLRSVQKAFEHVGARAKILSDVSDLPGIGKLVLPGVGAFADGMEHLSQRHWVEPLKAFIASGRPFLGICLGLQLLFDGSQEDAPDPATPVEGLSILPGQVVRFPNRSDQGRLKVPHMGWNTLRWDRDDPLLRGLRQEVFVYFVHSFHAVPAGGPKAPTSAVSEYGGPFCASVWKDNIWATQFHPEKSQAVGLKMLENFAAM